jgi:putative FmdB family regulatory protein
MTYEYACEACGHTWEAEQRIKDAALKECVSCGAPKAKRLISGGTGFLLKGGGWYADGYGSAAPSKSSGDAESSASAKSTSGDATSKDSGGKDSGSKDSGGKDSGSKKAEPTSSESKTSDSGSKGSSDTGKTAASAS